MNKSEIINLALNFAEQTEIATVDNPDIIKFMTYI